MLSKKSQREDKYRTISFICRIERKKENIVLNNAKLLTLEYKTIYHMKNGREIRER